MNMKQLQYVLVLAEKKNFSSAAEVLGISQPSLSQYIKTIEKQLGIELFYRAGGNIRLTEAGKVYVDSGRKILDLERLMENCFSDLKDEKTGSLIIGCAPFRTSGILPQAISEFRKEYPLFSVRIEERVTSELIDGTERGDFDICLTTLPIDERLFDSVEIFEEEMVLAVPSGYPQFESKAIEGRRHSAIDASLIDGRDFITLSSGQVMQQALEKFCTDNSLEINSVVSLTNLSAQISMVSSGIGMALVPSSIEKLCQDGSVRFYSFKNELPKRKIAVIYRKNNLLSNAAKKFIEILINENKR